MVSDSYMGFFLPADIYERLLKFLDGNLHFPFVKENEILGIFFLFGKNYGIKTELDILSAKDISRKTIDQLKREIIQFRNNTQFDNDYIREKYQRRVLQVYVEIQNDSMFEQIKANERISRDPTLLMYCYAHHVSYYRQKCFFEIYEPFKKDQLDKKFYDLLLNRMVMLSYNVEKTTDLPYKTITPFVEWIVKNN
ncbi:conserved protein of unknown function [Candidatus Nitrosocosmicus franklandus]|uniref:Uncharacterized protein n=1 Tax=Candidatus Nitrosocosmicus franklandianus TaxID=1798806 RepID=A0A484I7R5_9ARCH|nr:conserved protein of unknown function [Candidatus Nitrosocosmicus franklandus]